jgi:hypothetical protein
MKFRLLASIALFSAFSIAIVAANPPVQFSDTQTISNNIVCADGTLIAGTATFNENGTAFFDASGNTTHVILHDFITQTFTGPTGKTASGTNRQNETFDVNTHAFSVRGLFANVRAADGTILMHAGGRLAIDSNGNVSVTPQITVDQTPALCAALE